LRVVYYSRPCFFDHFLPQIHALSQLVELHAVLELSPEGWNSSYFDVSPQKMPKTILDGKAFLAEYFPGAIQTYWKECASFTLIGHQHPKSLHPKTWKVSQYAIEQILKMRPDVLHLDDISFRLAPILWKIGKIPLILTIHDPSAHLGEENWRWTVARILSFHKASHFIVHSEFSRKQFVEIYSTNTKMLSKIPLGILNVYREFLDSSIKEKHSPSVLFFGRISPYKGVEVFIQAAELVSQKISHCTFLIAGRPIKGYKISRLPSLENHCTIQLQEGFLLNKEVARLMMQSSVVVCPYLDATQSGVVLTAYAFGKPVVATQVGGLPEYVHHGKTGLLVPPGDPYALAQAIIYLLQHPKKREEMKRSIQRLAETELSWSRIAEQTIEVYKKVLGRHAN